MTRGWTGLLCPKCKCKGTGVSFDDLGPQDCPACDGTGDEYGELPDDDGPPAVEEPPE